MNQFLVTLFAIVGIQLTPYAQQDADKSEFTVGLRSGLNFSNVWDAEGEDFTANGKLGFVGGVFAGIPIGEFFGFQPELLLSQKGFQASGTIFGNPYSYRKTTTFLDVPLQLQLKPSPFLTIVAGPQYSFLLLENNAYTFNGDSMEEEEAFENENIRRNILGATAGIDITMKHLMISGRVCGDLQNNHGDGESSTPRYKNQWVQLTIGLRL